MKNSSGGLFINFNFMESFKLLVPNADLCCDISSDKAFWLGGNKNEMRALVKG